jgi:hypothetical protein
MNGLRKVRNVPLSLSTHGCGPAGGPLRNLVSANFPTDILTINAWPAKKFLKGGPTRRFRGPGVIESIPMKGMARPGRFELPTF